MMKPVELETTDVIVPKS